MALRIPWDKYESALLLDMYFKVASGEIKRQQAVVKLSADLRNLAINRGIVIDDLNFPYQNCLKSLINP